MNFKLYLLIYLIIECFSVLDNIIQHLVPVAEINTSQSSYSIKKIQTKLNMIIALSNDFNVYTWNATQFTALTPPSTLTDALYKFHLNYTDFTCDSIDSISFMALKRIAVINLTSNNIPFYTNKLATPNNIETQLTVSQLIIIDSTRTILIYNRTNYIKNSYIIPQTVLLSSESTTNHIKVCQFSSQIQYLIYWNSCNAIVLSKITKGTVQDLFNWPSTYPSCSENIKQIKFNANCSLIIIQKDSLANIQIFNTIKLNEYSYIEKPSQKVHQVQFYNPASSKVVMVFYQNNSIVYYDIGQSIGVYVGQISLNYTLSSLSYIDTDVWRLYHLQNFTLYILQLQCGNGVDFYNKCCDTQKFYNSTSSNCQSCLPTFPYFKYCNSINCLACTVGTLQGGLCCQSTEYYNSSLLVCQNCSIQFDYCNTCNQISCLSCLSGTNFNGLCCQTKEYYNGSLSVCQKCYQVFNYCDVCNQSGCLSCLAGTFNEGKCCQSNQYFNSNDIQCQLCSSKFINCLYCTQNICLSCLTGTLKHGKCCFQNEKYNARSGQCQSCTANCLRCESGSCLLCKKTFVLILNTCTEVSNDTDLIALSTQIESVSNDTIKNPLTIQTINNSIAKTFLNTACGYFGPLDDLWMFSYHQRNYTLTVSSILNQIREIQSSKFNLFENIKVISNLNNLVIQKFNNYSYFGKQKYMAIEKIGSGFYQNIVNFSLVMIPYTLIFILVFQIFFALLINSQVSKYLRKYTFNFFLILTLFDGNTQFFSYITSNQLQTLFQLNADQKAWMKLFILIGFIFVQSFTAIYLLMSYFYKNLQFYFLENCKNSIFGVFIFLVISNIRSVIVASISSFSSNNYNTLIWLLNVIEVIFLLTLIVFFKKYKCFKNKSDFFIIVTFSFIRLVLQLSFALLNTINIQKDIQQLVQSFIILIYLLYWVSTILYYLLKLIIQSLFKFYSKKDNKKNSAVNSNTINLNQKTKNLIIRIENQQYKKKKNNKKKQQQVFNNGKRELLVHSKKKDKVKIQQIKQTNTPKTIDKTKDHILQKKFKTSRTSTQFQYKKIVKIIERRQKFQRYLIQKHI